MGSNWMVNEYFQPQLTAEILNGITPVKTEPQVLRAISELISAQLFTQQLIQQIATQQVARVGQAFVGQAQRPAEAAAFDASAEPVRLLTQRLEELEKRLDEATAKKAAMPAR